VSLILEALKKLEREKQAPDRGFLVLAHVPWAVGPRGRSRWLLLFGAVGLVVAGGAALGLLWGRRPPPTEPATTPEAAAAEPSPPPASNLPAVVPSASVASAPAPSPRSPNPPARALEVPSPSPAADMPEVELRLNAISRQDGHPVAILNDRLVREGDVFDGIRVVRILETEVEVEVNGERRLVRF
jgi:hypothetical protein